MTELLSQILNGLAIGNVYAMLAIGFVLVFGVANLINFAQGSLFVVGGYLAYTFAVLLGLPLILAATLAVALTALLGLVIDRAFLRPLERGPRIAPLLATLAIAVILDETVHLIWSPDTKPFPSPLASTTWQVGNAYISAVDVLILVVGVGTIVALTLFLNRTWIGRAMRATAMDPEAAQQMGVDVALMRSLTFAIAGLVGGVGGVLVGFYYQAIWPTMGIPLGIKGFTAALLGGISSIPGAIVGGLLLGVFEALASGYLGSIYRNLIAYSLLLLVLFFRPQGSVRQPWPRCPGWCSGGRRCRSLDLAHVEPVSDGREPRRSPPRFGSPSSSLPWPRAFPSGRPTRPGCTSWGWPSSTPSWRSA